jgi:hypothetical protein
LAGGFSIWDGIYYTAEFFEEINLKCLINNFTQPVIPVKAGIQKNTDKTGFPPARE